MKKAIQLGILILGMSGCAVTIPLQTNLSEQTLLLAKNRNLKANYTLNSDLPNGYINYVTVSKNGSETASSGTYMYENETAFRSIWDSYFSNKFNEYSKKEIDITVKMMNLYLVQKNLTSGARGALLGNVQMNVEAICKIDVKIEYNGKTYGKKITSKVSEYNESQSTNINGTIYTSNASNPTQQKAKLLEQCLNRAVIQFENYLVSVLAE